MSVASLSSTPPVGGHPTSTPQAAAASSAALAEGSLSGRIYQACKDRNFFTWCGSVREELNRDINTISAAELKTILDRFFHELPQEGDVEAALKTLDSLIEIIPQAKLQSALGMEGNPRAAAEEALDKAKAYLEKTKKPGASSFTVHLRSIFEGILSVIESLLTAFGIADFLKPRESEVQTDFRVQRVMMQISLMVMLLTVLAPIMGPLEAGKLIGGIFFSVWALSLIYPYFKPKSSYIHPGKNWSREAQYGALALGKGREAEVRKIGNILSGSLGTPGKHALLLGESGVGKTTIVKAFAHAVERGDFPKLKGKTVIYFNTAEIVSHTEMFGGNKILAHISEAMGRHKDDFILVFDEIHLVCQEAHKKQAIGDKLKTSLDEGGAFPYVIGLTTDAEYRRDILSFDKAGAFARRFEPLPIAPLAKDELLEIFLNFHLREAPDAVIDRDVFNHLYEALGGNTATAQRVLENAFKKTATTQTSSTARDIERIKREIRYRTIEAFCDRGVASAAAPRPTKAALQAQLQELEQRLKEEEAAIELAFKIKRKIPLIRKLQSELVLKINSTPPGEVSAADLNKYSMLENIVIPALLDRVRADATRLGMRMVVDRALIDEVLQEDRENQAKMAKMKQEVRSPTAPAAAPAAAAALPPPALESKDSKTPLLVALP